MAVGACLLCLLCIVAAVLLSKKRQKAASDKPADVIAMPISYVDEHDIEMVSARNEAPTSTVPALTSHNSTADIYARVGNLRPAGEINYAASFEYGSSAPREPVVYGQMAPDNASSVVYGQMGGDGAGSVVYESLPE